MFVMRWAERHT